MNLKKWNGEDQDAAILHRRLGGTFVLAEVKGEPAAPVYLHRIYHGGIDGNTYVDVYSDEDVGRRVVIAKEIEVISAVPTSGLYAYMDGVVLVRRTARRQMQDGTCAGTVALTVNGEHSYHDVRWEVVRAVFAPQVDIPLEEGLKLVPERKALRLTRFSWLKNDAKTKTISLFRTNARVGSWVLGKKFFYSADGQILSEEIKDELNFHAKKTN